MSPQLEVPVALSRYDWMRKKSHCGPEQTSAAKAAVHSVMFTARLKPRPFKAKSNLRVFPQPARCQEAGRSY